MSARVAVVLFPGTNSEAETQRALAAAGIDAEIVHWSLGSAGLRPFDAFVLPGGFSYEDRVRAGAVAK
jgi:phosphoribosylformylglycinamidine (FGAM) synthase-like amidotransferase family enzyme